MKNLLVSLGWDADHIWNAGGWWYYEGMHGVKVARDNGHGQTTWDFHNVPTHVIDFDTLHAVGSEPEDSSEGAAELVDGLTRLRSHDELQAAISGGADTVVYVYLPGCSSCAKFAPIVGELARSGEVATYAIAYGDLSDASLRKLIGHAPGVVVFSGGKPVASLSADKDEDMPAYRSLHDLTTWLSKSVKVPVLDGTATAEIDCEDGCEP
jgi:thiol-disulfide isomerase/thioredoxin